MYFTRFVRTKKRILCVGLVVLVIITVSVYCPRNETHRLPYLQNLRPQGAIRLIFPSEEHAGPEYIRDIQAKYIAEEKLHSSAVNRRLCVDNDEQAHLPCWDAKCNASVLSPEDTWSKVLSYPTFKYREHIAAIRRHLNESVSVVESDIVMVTGASAEFFYPAQGLLRDLHKKVLAYYGNVKIIFYDLGLSSCQRLIMERYCKCHVKDFPFEIFPPHVKNTKNYAWKPLVLQMELLQHKVVTWLDTSVRLKIPNIADIFQTVVDVGILPSAGEFSVAQQTDTKMFQWFREEPCLFSSYFEIQPGYIMLYKNSLVEAILRSWISCALSEECIAPQNNVYDCDNSVWRYGKCHRFDQSALSIILSRVFQESRAILHLTEFELQKRQPVSYFPEQPSIFCFLR